MQSCDSERAFCRRFPTDYTGTQCLRVGEGEALFPQRLLRCFASLRFASCAFRFAWGIKNLGSYGRLGRLNFSHRLFAVVNLYFVCAVDIVINAVCVIVHPGKPTNIGALDALRLKPLAWGSFARRKATENVARFLVNVFHCFMPL